MTLTVLTDDQIKGLLENLTSEELLEFMESLRCALHDYSTSTQGSGVENTSIHQPERTSISSAATGATTLFMPSSSSVGTGIKVVTLSSPQTVSEVPQKENRPPNIKPTGAITLFSPHGTPVGFLHASTLTAFRTALASLCLVSKRDKVHTLMVFGCGEQAYWHVRLTLLLRGSQGIKRVYFVNPTFSESAREILRRFIRTPEEIKHQEGWQGCEFGVLTANHTEYERLLTEQLLEADVIFCCTPSTKVLFPGNILTTHDGRRKGRLIVAIGSYTPEMREIPEELIKQALRGAEHGHTMHFHRHAVEGGVVVVDTLDGALKEAGELIALGVRPESLVELGELVMLHKMRLKDDEDEENNKSGNSEHNSETESAASDANKETKGGMYKYSHAHKQKKKKDTHLARWLQKGNVIYKSVGLGLMDLTVGMQVVKYAKNKGVGSYVEGF
ncbi:putative ornithine cyclodeaminase [Podospora australis]|uniref:Ornithine cyclodeaminase n=1 Tax=Podospora australis TaxID=1536484 RepID=A0AAN6WXC1_9PEZI|nr:putative ornithine cyclodeaminase [Podospora australis]